MRKFFVPVLLLVVFVACSCGKPMPNQKHLDSFSMLPDFVVTKSSESGNSVTLYSFDMDAIRENIQIDKEKPHSGQVNNLGIAVSRNYEKNGELGILDLYKMKYIATCPYWNVQAFTPADGLLEKISEAGFIEEIIGDGYLLTKDFEDNITAELAPVNCFFDDTIVQVTTTAKLQKEAVTLMLMEEGNRVDEFPAISEILKLMPEYQAICLVFSFDRFSELAEDGSVLGFFDDIEQYEMIPKFEIWGRPDSYRMGAIGSSVVDGIEHSTIVLLYDSEKSAKDDKLNVDKALLSVPSMVDGNNWMKHMNFGKPIVRVQKNAIFIDFDIENRKKEDGLFSMQMLKFMDKTGDWGVFWRK
ncbi:MAG: hypothetical protein R2883_01370 [Caldisericia bacterium]